MHINTTNVMTPTQRNFDFIPAKPKIDIIYLVPIISGSEFLFSNSSVRKIDHI